MDSQTIADRTDKSSLYERYDSVYERLRKEYTISPKVPAKDSVLLIGSGTGVTFESPPEVLVEIEPMELLNPTAFRNLSQVEGTFDVVYLYFYLHRHFSENGYDYEDLLRFVLGCYEKVNPGGGLYILDHFLQAREPVYVRDADEEILELASKNFGGRGFEYIREKSGQVVLCSQPHLYLEVAPTYREIIPLEPLRIFQTWTPSQMSSLGEVLNSAVRVNSITREATEYVFRKRL